MVFEGFTLSWAGECSAWECDELGHMNMRHYVHKTDEARRFLMIALGLNHAYGGGTISTVRVRDFHIKYQGEARPGAPLRIDSAVIAVDEATAKLCHIMTHRDGKIAATMVEMVEHVYLPEDKVFPWPRRFTAAAQARITALPAPAKPRNVDGAAAHIGMSLSELETAGGQIIGAGVFSKKETDVTKQVKMGSMFGRTTSTVAWFREGWPEFENPDYQAGGMSAALLEMRAVFHRYPRRGDAYVYIPALIGANIYTREFVHNIVDPVSGENWCSMQAAGCKFNLKTRKLVKATDEDLSVLESGMLRGIKA